MSSPLIIVGIRPVLVAKYGQVACWCLAPHSELQRVGGVTAEKISLATKRRYGNREILWHFPHQQAMHLPMGHSESLPIEVPSRAER